VVTFAAGSPACVGGSPGLGWGPGRVGGGCCFACGDAPLTGVPGRGPAVGGGRTAVPGDCVPALPRPAAAAPVRAAASRSSGESLLWPFGLLCSWSEGFGLGSLPGSPAGFRSCGPVAL